MQALAAAGCASEAPTASATRQAVINGAFDDDSEVRNGVVLLLNPASSTRPYCTGTLLSSRYVLTAAHCVAGIADSGRNVVVGPSIPSRYTAVLTDGCWIHPLAYGNGSSACLPTGGLPASTPSPTYDVALLRLSQPVSRTSAKPTPVLLATPGGVSAWPGQEVTVVGYGETPSVLQTRVRGNATLSDFNGSFQWFLPPSGSSEARAAPGDSGGPLLWPVSSSRPSIVAVHHGVVGILSGTGRRPSPRTSGAGSTT